MKTCRLFWLPWLIVIFALLVALDGRADENARTEEGAEGDHKIHVAKVERKRLVLDPRFEADFNTAFGSGPARPHGIGFH